MGIGFFGGQTHLVGWGGDSSQIFPISHLVIMVSTVHLKILLTLRYVTLVLMLRYVTVVR